LHKKFEALNTELLAAQRQLNESAQKLLDLHKELMDEAGVPDEPEIHDDGSLRVVTTHGTYIVGSECPKHKRVHHMAGWYICVDGGFVNVNGWFPEKAS
jgi:hypothetical protein